MLRTALLLLGSNLFMTLAWYGFLKEKNIPLWKAILLSWGIAFFEYCLMIPANRHGYTNGMSGFQLKILQEIITLLIFTLFAVFYLREPFKWNYVVSFGLILGAVYFAFKP
ncbi:MAG: DMT family protein [Chitinophagaceae bacterium]|nr:DMT family protein [Chitinophagaceae bacterium]